MKKLLYLLFLLPIASIAQTKVTPDCVIPFDFTAAASTINGTCGAPNGAPNNPGIAFWVVSYYSTGFTGLTLTVQSAPASGGSPGSWGTFGGTVLTSTQVPGSSGINPNTALTSAFTGLAGYYPWMRVTLSGLTGSGEVKGSLVGYLNSTLAKGGGGGGGGGGPTIAGTSNQIVVTGAGCTTPSTSTCTISLPGGITIDSSGNVVTPGSIKTGSGSGLTGALDLVAKTSGDTSTVTVDDTNPGTTVKLPADTTAGLYAVTSPTATPAAGCAQYNGTGTQATSTGIGCGAPSASGGASNGYSAPAVTLPAAGTTFIPPVGGALPSTTETNVQWIAPVTAPITDLSVLLSAAIGTGNTIAFTFRDNASSQAVTCTASGTGAGGTTCKDLVHSFNVTEGDLLAIQITTTGIVAIAPTITIAFEYGGGGSGGSGALTLISKQTLGSAIPTVTFSAIPGTYTDLLLTMTTRGDASASTVGPELQFNADTGTNYNWAFILGTNGSSSSSSGSSETAIFIGNISAANAQTSAPGTIQVVIPNYAGTTFIKTVLASSVAMGQTGFGGGGVQVLQNGGFWNNTAAITSLVVTTGAGGGGGNFIVGSVFALYGRQ